MACQQCHLQCLAYFCLKALVTGIDGLVIPGALEDGTGDLPGKDLSIAGGEGLARGAAVVSKGFAVDIKSLASLGVATRVLAVSELRGLWPGFACTA
jgi:hypothetical protein